MNIPHLDAPSVDPNTQAAPRQTAHTQSLGALAQVGDMVNDLAAKANSAVVMGKIAKLNESRIDMMNNPKTGFLSTMGENALNVTPKGLQAYDKLYNDTLDSLMGPQKALFRQHTAHMRGEVQLQLERHEAEQGKALQIGNSKALVESDQQILSTLFRDQDAFNKKLKETQAHILDLLHLHGISDNSPQAKEALFKSTSEAYVNMIKQTLTENPSQARHLFEVHQDEIDVKDRDHLQHSIGVISDEKEGIDAAFAMADHIKAGDKTETEMEKMLHDQFANKPGAFKHAKAQLNDLLRKVHDDNVNAAATAGEKIETAIDEAFAKGQLLSASDIHNMPEYQELVKMGHKEGAAEFNKIRAYVAKVKGALLREKREEEREADRRRRDIEHIKIERRRAAAEERREQRDRADEFKLNISDPETLTTMTETELKQRGRAAGLKFKDIKELDNQRKKFLKDGKSKEAAQADHDFIQSIITKMPGVSKADAGRYTSKAQSVIARIEAEEKRHLKPAERQQVLIEAMQQVSLIEHDWWGLTSKDIKKPALDVVKPEHLAAMVRMEKAWGKQFTPERRQRFLQDLAHEDTTK